MKMETMLRLTKCILIVLCAIWHAANASSSIYGSEFDYTKAKPAREYFSGKSNEQIALYCKKEMLGTTDSAACAQFRYEVVANALGKRISVIEKTLQDDDKENVANGEPAALPFFKKSQMNWALYRDNDCYSDVYSVGQASLRFIDFWDCMSRITKNRLDELTKPNDDE